MNTRIGISLCVLVGLVLLDSSAYAGDGKRVDWREGMWRLELQGFGAIRSGRRSRADDYGFIGSMEYEIPMTRRLTLGPRIIPLFVHDQKDSGEDTIFAVGFGPQLRYYSHADEYRGFFAEINSILLAQTGRFDGNSGAFNFMSEGGIGWKFKSRWHISTKIRHISNSGLAAHNSGVNSVSVGFGYTFKGRLRKSKR